MARADPLFPKPTMRGEGFRVRKAAPTSSPADTPLIAGRKNEEGTRRHPVFGAQPRDPSDWLREGGIVVGPPGHLFHTHFPGDMQDGLAGTGRVDPHGRAGPAPGRGRDTQKLALEIKPGVLFRLSR